MANFVENKMESWIKLYDKIIKLLKSFSFCGGAQKNHEVAILVPTIDREERSRLSKQHKKESDLVSRQ